MDRNAGKLPPKELLENIVNLVSAYYLKYPNVENPAELISFGTSGHRGSSFDGNFNEAHIFAITQALVDYRKEIGIEDKALFIGMDTHALSTPAHNSALQVLAGNGVKVYYSKDFEYTPTPVISYTILNHSKSDGIVITPSHNPPRDGGFKYNSVDGGPADVEATKWIEERANSYLRNNLKGVLYLCLEEALKAKNIEPYDFMTPYVEDLKTVIDFEIIRAKNIKIGADCMGGSGRNYYQLIAKTYNLDIEVFNSDIDFRFPFICCDRDGKIRMDCSSPFAMASLIDLKDRFDISFGNDTDFDRHGIVTKSAGLLNPNHYLSVAIDYLSKNRDFKDFGVGKTIVSSSIIDRVVEADNKTLFETPVGFKWFVKPFLEKRIFFAGEESAGATFLKFNGDVWTTDKDGIILNLLSVEILAKTGYDPAIYYKNLTKIHGNPIYERLDVSLTFQERERLKSLKEDSFKIVSLAGEKIVSIVTEAKNGAKFGGLKINTKSGWVAIRASGTENVYKIYAESFKDRNHLREIQIQVKELIRDYL